MCRLLEVLEVGVAEHEPLRIRCGFIGTSLRGYKLEDPARVVLATGDQHSPVACERIADDP